MKHTLLATTALVAMTGAAAAELTISGTGRIGVKTTEGAAATVVGATYGTITAVQRTTLMLFGLATGGAGANADEYNDGGTAVTFTAANSAAVAADITKLDAMIVLATARLADARSTGVASVSNSAALAAEITTDLATMNTIRDQLVLSEVTTATAKLADVTSGVNRFRIAFAGSGETDSGISYGISGRAEQSDTTTAGSQYVSGAFGKISMGDLGGADKDAAGHIDGGVGVSALGTSNEILYQARNHNLGYEFSTNGLTFGYSQDTAVQTGSNSAMGIKWSGDMGGTGLTVGLGQSKMGTSTQSTMSVGVSMSGLTIKAISSTNDNGPAVAFAAGTARTATTATVFAADTLAVANNDTDHTGVSISYAMDAMTVTAYTKTVSTLGAVDQDYTGFGITYDMGGVKLKAGMVEDNDISSMDIGLSFSF